MEESTKTIVKPNLASQFKPTPSYTFKATATFWENFEKLDIIDQKMCHNALKVFKQDPFNKGLNVHKISELTKQAGRTILSATVRGNLKVIFVIDGNLVTSMDVGTHAIYNRR